MRRDVQHAFNVFETDGNIHLIRELHQEPATKSQRSGQQPGTIDGNPLLHFANQRIEPYELALPVLFFGPRDFGQVGQRLPHCRVVFLFDQWQQLVADAVAQVFRTSVGSVFAPRLIEGVQILLDVTTPGSEQRANDARCQLRRGIAKGRNRHQAACTRSAQNAQQDGFRLVVQGMRGGDLVAGARLQQPFEKLVAQLAGAGFTADTVLLAVPWDIHTLRMQRQIEAGSQLHHKLLVGIRFRATHPMMHVHHAHHDSQLCPQLQQRPQQRHAVRASGDGDGHAIAGAKERMFADKGFDRREHEEMVQPTSSFSSAIHREPRLCTRDGTVRLA